MTLIAPARGKSSQINSKPLTHLNLTWAPETVRIKDKILKVDLFRHTISSSDGLPPYAQARIIDLISTQLKKHRYSPCLWVTVDAPGAWYLNEVKRLVRYIIPTIILTPDQDLYDHGEFRCRGYCPLLYLFEEQNFYPAHVSPPFSHADYGLSKESVVRVLRILARLKTAHTKEITSLAGYSKTYVRGLLKELQSKGMIEWKRIGKYDGWAIKTRGMRLAHRSWNVPKGAHFAQYRGEVRYSGERHRRVSRMWRAWLEAAYPYVEIWESWTEVQMRRGIPDGLAWGQRYGREILFWLEVESGHSSRQVMSKQYSRRLQLAMNYAYDQNIMVVFCLMGPPWVVKEFDWIQSPPFYSEQSRFAIIGHDWRDFGHLPIFEAGYYGQDLDHSETRFSIRSRSSEGLSFDPTKYPRRYKKKKNPKQPKQKSNKPRYISPNYEEEIYWESDPNDR